MALSPANTKKIVLIAGKKSHGPGDHEYEKGLRLLAHCLENASNLTGYTTEVHLYGWPDDPETLSDADAIVLYCDGADHGEANHPLLLGDRLKTLRRAMKRGAGLIALHYTVFVPTEHGGKEFLDWIGGYFDYESGTGTPPWYSKIRWATTTTLPASPEHPISCGLTAFPLHEEYYYNIRFPENHPHWTPILNTPIPDEPEIQTVAWAVQREDGGRGFGFTGGHLHSNWWDENFRRLVLNAIVWAAQGEVPEGGVQSVVPEAIDSLRVLLLTGYHHPAHDWRGITEALQEVLGRDDRVRIQIVENLEALPTIGLDTFDLLIQNYNNWDRPTIPDAAKAHLLKAIEAGKGLFIVHFANGAFLEWSEYRRLCRRVWIEGVSSHDAYGAFRVHFTDTVPLLTAGLSDFDTTDELYCNQQGDLPMEVLMTAHSQVSGQDEPLAAIYVEGKARIFLTLLGHDAQAVRQPDHAELIRRAVAWSAHREVLPQNIEKSD